MKNGKCPNCGSSEIYVCDQSVTENISLKSKTRNVESFKTEVYLCMDCRKVELYASETSLALFGKGKILKDLLPTSDNWKKVNH